MIRVDSVDTPWTPDWTLITGLIYLFINDLHIEWTLWTLKNKGIKGIINVNRYRCVILSKRCPLRPQHTLLINYIILMGVHLCVHPLSMVSTFRNRRKNHEIL
jgi:hypothetical protein